MRYSMWMLILYTRGGTEDLEILRTPFHREGRKSDKSSVKDLLKTHKTVLAGLTALNTPRRGRTRVR